MKKILYWLPPIIWMLTIFLLSSQQRVSVTNEFVLDLIIFKSAHVFIYALLYYLVFKALYRTTKMPLSTQLNIALIISVAYGISDEIHQTLVPTRNGKVYDVFVDTVGITLMYLFLLNNFKKLKKYL